MSRIERRFAALKAEGRAALVTFVTAGDPDYETSLAIVRGLPRAGADIIEFGMPFTDPAADGPSIQASGLRALKAGYHYGDTSETFTTRFEVKPAPMPKGTYRSITGNQGTALGLIAGAQKAKLDLFYGSYPITPASDILHELSRHKNFNVLTFQAEDEIAAIGSAIGASYGGALGVTASSGPGIALKTEAMGLAFMLEIPLVIVNVQRGGPSTGLPTKTEQADLWQAVHGRNGEAPIPVIAASTPINNCAVDSDDVIVPGQSLTHATSAAARGNNVSLGTTECLLVAK